MKYIIKIAFIALTLILSLFLMEYILHFSTNKYTKVSQELHHTVHPTYVDDAIHIPGYGKSFIGFKEKLAFKESQGKYNAVNSLGYLGKYQFGPSTLATMNIYDTLGFLKNPKIQEKTFIKYLEQNKKLLANEINTYSGTYVKGVEITESGILAAAHLAGVGNVKKYLKSNGRSRVKDAYGTRIEHYLKEFAHYDLSVIDTKQKTSS